MCICLSVNTITLLNVRDIVKKFSGHHPMVERADKFENDYTAVTGD